MKLKSSIADDGTLASPTLPNGVKNYLIDIDGTVTDDVPNEEYSKDKYETFEKCRDQLREIMFENGVKFE